MAAEIRHFCHEPSGTLGYVISDPQTSAAAVIDPVLGFSVVSGRTNTTSAQAIIDYVRKHELTVAWILETHAHADHLSAAQFLKTALGGKVALGEGIRSVQTRFTAIFNAAGLAGGEHHDFDHLFADGEEFDIGSLRARVLHTPGHTNDSVSYLIGAAVLVGDTVFMTDSGTARCDFPGGDAGVLYDSIQKLFALPDNTILYLCHDYPPAGRSLCFEVPLREQIADNIHVGGMASKDEFVVLRTARDAGRSLPILIVPSIQVNIRAGHLPESEDNGTAYLKIPLDVL